MLHHLHGAQDEISGKRVGAERAREVIKTTQNTSKHPTIIIDSQKNPILLENIIMPKTGGLVDPQEVNDLYLVTEREDEHRERKNKTVLRSVHKPYSVHGIGG